MSESPLSPRFKLRLDWYRAHGFDFTVTRDGGEYSIELKNEVIHRWEKFTFKTEREMEDWNLGLKVTPASHEWKQETTVVQFTVPGQEPMRPQEEGAAVRPRRKIEP